LALRAEIAAVQESKEINLNKSVLVKNAQIEDTEGVEGHEHQDSVKQESLNPVTGQPFTPPVVVYRDNYSLTGWVSGDLKTIVLATPAPEIDTVMSGPDPTTATLISKVICHESHTLTRLDE